MMLQPFVSARFARLGLIANLLSPLLAARIVTLARTGWRFSWLLLVAAMTPSALADRTWDRGAGTNFWTDAANWNPDGLPTSADAVIFTDTGAGTVDLNGTSIPASGSLLGLTFNNATTGYTVQNGGTIFSNSMTHSAGAAVSNTVSARLFTNTISVNSGKLVLSHGTNVINGPVTVAGGATLNVLAPTSNSIGSVTLGGGTLVVRGAVTTTGNALLDRIYLRSPTESDLNPISNLFAFTPDATRLATLPITYDNSRVGVAGNDNQNGNNGAYSTVAIGTYNGGNQTNFETLTTGRMSLSAPATLTFGTRSDDGSVLYIDKDNNGVFDPSTELVVDNNNFQGYTNATGTVTLNAGTYHLAIGYYQGASTNDNGVEVRYGIGSGLGYNDAAMQVLHPASPIAGLSFSFDTFDPANLSGSNLTVTGAGSVLDLQAPTGSVGNVAFNNGTSLAIQGTAGSALSTGNLSGTGSATLTNSIATTVNNVSGFTTLNKGGAGTLTLTGTTPYAGATTIEGGILAINHGNALGTGDVNVDAGELRATADLTLAPGNIRFRNSATTLSAAAGTTLAVNATNWSLEAGANVTIGSPGQTGTVALGSSSSLSTAPGAHTLAVNFGILRATGSFLPAVMDSFNTVTVATGATLKVNDQQAGGHFLLNNLQGEGTVETGGSATTKLRVTSGNFSGAIEGPGQLEKTTTGTLTLTGYHTYGGVTTVSAGTFLIDGWMASDATVKNSATLGGGGTAGAVTLESGGTVAPGTGSGTGVLEAAAATFVAGSQLSVNLNGATEGAGYDRLSVTGTCTLGDATLAVSPGYAAAAGTAFTIVSAGAVTGNFQGLPQGVKFAAGGSLFTIQYTATAVVLTSANLFKSLTDGAFDLFAATGFTAGSGSFSGIGVSGSNFSPATAGLGVHTITFTPTSGSPVTFNIIVTEVPSLIVTTTSDEANAIDGQTSLREAIAYANSLETAPTVTFSNTTDNGAVNFHDDLPEVIALTDGELALIGNVTIAGPGAGRLTVERSLEFEGPNFSIFFIDDFAAANLSGLTIANGRAQSYSGEGPTTGGGIYNAGIVTVTDCVLRDNAAEYGGGLYSDGNSVTLIRCTIRDNVTIYEGSGAGLAVDYGTLKVIACTLTGNGSEGDGGAILVEGGTAEVIQSTIAGNEAASAGGGICLFDGTASVSHSTIVDNAAYRGGGLYQSGYAGQFNVGHSLIALNTATAQGPDAYNSSGEGEPSQFTSQGFNLIGNRSGSGGFTAPSDLENAAPGLELDTNSLPKLADNGGPTRTVKLLPGSPAIDAGDPAFVPGTFTPPLTTDQRGTGFARVVRGKPASTMPKVDIGAYEVQSPAAPTFAPGVAANGLSIGTSDPALDLNGTTVGATPPGGIFIGTGTSGINGATFTPSTLAPGPYVITYTRAPDGYGLTASAQFTITVVDNTPPIVTGVSSPAADGTYRTGQQVEITVAFSEPVTVTGLPRLALATGGAGTPVDFASGNGTNTLTFLYAVAVGDTSPDLDCASTDALTGGTIRDAAGNAAARALPAPGAAGSLGANKALVIDAVAPTVTITVADTALRIGETSLVTFTFTEAVNGFANTDLTVPNGSLTPVTSTDEGVTWTATFTPAAGITDPTNVITLNNTGVTDAAGNPGTGTTDSNNFAIDTVGPTVTITIADTALRIGETALVTFAFSEAVSGFANTDLTVPNGSLTPVTSTDEGVTWTATFTPAAGITDPTNVITLNNAGVTDAVGNPGTGTTDSNNFAIDTAGPTVTIMIADTALRIGETSLVTFAFSEAVSGFANTDLTVPNGSLTPVTSTDEGVTWTATFTPAAGITDPTNVITLNNTGVTDAAGNPGTGTTDSNNFAIDTAGPTVTITVADTALRIGETSLVTFTFTEAVSGFANTDLTVPNGSLTPVTSTDEGVTWTATFTPAAGITDPTNVITLNNAGVTDAAGNPGTGTTDSNNYAIDTAGPTVTIAVADTALRIGETSLVTFAFSEAVSGFANTDLTVPNGSLTPVNSTDGGITWTATFAPTAGVTDPTNVITLNNTGVTDTAGNAGTGTTDSNNFAIDTAGPTVTITVADTALRIGETALVTFAFSEAVSGFANTDLTVPNGSLTPVTSTDGGLTWTATFTPAAGITDPTNVITLNNAGVTDAAGNPGTGTTDSNNFAIDTAGPTVTIAVADTALRIGETALVTFAFSEAVSGFANTDLTVPNGSLTPVTSTDEGVTWTATFTPAAGIIDQTNVITLNNTGVTDAAGNPGTGTTDSNNFAIDTAGPTVTIAVADTALRIGETALVTFAFSEAVNGFANTDLTVPNGSLTPVNSTDGGLTWTATFTPAAGITDPTNVITLNNAGVTDAAGNPGTGTTDSNNFAIDTAGPTVTIAVADTALRIGETALVTFAFSEAVSGFANTDLTVPNGSLTPVTSTDEGVTWTATFTPAAGITDQTNVITLNNTGVTDAAGNPGTGTTNSNNFAIDTLAPTLTIGEPSVTMASQGPASFTITYPDADFANSTLGAGDVTLNKTDTADGQVTVTGTGNTRTVTISNLTGDGTLGISLATGTGRDTVGNLTPAAGPSATFIVDNTAPTLTLSGPSVATVGTGPVSFNVSYAGVSTISLTSQDVTLDKTGEANAASISISGIGASRTVTLMGITGNGTLGISLAAGTATDLAGNLAPSAGPSATVAVNNLPTIASASPAIVAQSTAAIVVLTGTNFVPDAQTVAFTAPGSAPVPVVPTAATTTSMTVPLPASLLAGPGTGTFTVTTSGGSATAEIRIVAPPVIERLSPGAALLGSADLAVTVLGANFVIAGAPAAMVRWTPDGGSAQNFGAVNVTDRSLTFTAPAALLAAVGTASVEVFIGNVVSAAATFTITGLRPVITSANPATLPTGTGTRTMVLTGKEFMPGAQTATFTAPGGAPVPMAIAAATATQITATIPAGQRATAGPGTISVTTGAGTGSITLAIANPAKDDSEFATGAKPIDIDVLANDAPVAVGTATVTILTPPQHGTAAVSAGKVLFTPNAVLPPEGDSFTYQYDDGAGGIGIATVTVVNLDAIAGSYDGLIEDPAATPGAEAHQRAGYLSVTIGKTGGFSGALTFSGQKLSPATRAGFRGFGFFDSKLGSAGDEVRIVVRRLNAPITLVLLYDAATRTITGTAESTDAAGRAFAAPLVLAARKGAGALEGKYTMLVDPDPTPGSPQGTGFATAKIESIGTVKLTGRLADGTSFSSTSYLHSDRTFPLYAGLYRGAPAGCGSVRGKMEFPAQPLLVGDAHGMLTWFKPARPRDAFFPVGFALRRSALLGRYQAPAPGTPLLTFDPGTDNGRAILDQGGFPMIDQLFTLNPTNTVIVSAPNFPKLTLRLDARTGVFSGNFLNPTTGKVTPFAGAVLQTDASGSGYFLGPGPTGAGAVEIGKK